MCLPIPRCCFVILVGAAVLAPIVNGQDKTRSVATPGFFLGAPKQFTNLSGRFSRTFIQEGITDSTAGEFFFLGPERMYIEVNYPLHQIMLIEANVTTIFYPSSSKAFVLESENSAILPLMPGLISAIQPDFGLSTLGMHLSRQEARGDTIIVLWSHPKARGKIGEFITAAIDDRLVYTLYRHPRAGIRSKIEFSEYLSAGGISFPGYIKSELQNQAGSSYELIRLHELNVNISIPTKVNNFRIPENADVERKSW